MKMVNLSLLASALLAAGIAASPAAAQDAGSDFTLSGGAAVVSDYRFRGISQTDRRFAVQGTVGVAHSSGLYGTIWGSSIDDYVANGADAELDLILGYSRTFGATTLDGGVIYYYYPGSGGVDSDFAEFYLSAAQAFGPATAKLTAAYAPEQAALTIGAGKEDNLYLAGDLSYAIPASPVSLNAHLGHSFGPSYLTIGDEYTDWALGASMDVSNLTFGLSYVDTSKSLFSPSGRNISKAGIVASVGVAF